MIRFHSRKFSASSNPPKRSSPLRWVPLLVGGTFVGVGALEYFYPKSITAYIPFLKNNVAPETADVKVKIINNNTCTCVDVKKYFKFTGQSFSKIL